MIAKEFLSSVILETIHSTNLEFNNELFSVQTEEFFKQIKFLRSLLINELILF